MTAAARRRRRMLRAVKESRRQTWRRRHRGENMTNHSTTATLATSARFVWRVKFRRANWGSRTRDKYRLFLDEGAARRFAARLLDQTQADMEGLAPATVTLDRRAVEPRWTLIGMAVAEPSPVAEGRLATTSRAPITVVTR